MSGIEFEFPLFPTEEELRQLQKEQTREKLQLLHGGKDKTENEEE